MVTRRQAIIGLLGVTLLWGGTFVWMKQILNNLDAEIIEFGKTSIISTMVAARFIIAFVLLLLFSKRARKALQSKEAWEGGAILGTLMFAGYLLQMIGINSVSPSVSAFLTSLYVVFTAILSTKISERKPTRMMLTGVILATIGAGFIDGPPHIVWGIGEILTVICALFFALHIIYTDKITKKTDPISVTSTSFAILIIEASIVSLFSSKDLSIIQTTWKSEIIIPLLLLGIFGSLFCILILNLFQKHLNPTHAAIIYSFEPVWATLYGWFEELVSITPWLGMGLLLLIGNIIVELDESKLSYRNEEAGPE
ncbi:MAG: DMT family transporter [Candidatus Poseidoniaceae archaeon]|jgi:drug/metabolite transporter (DMT)-like permease|nr:DMT family transporter [Candidatus Poseidoniaceae archaeon]